jgi:DNA polymerase-3 subunit epsilon
LIGPYFEELVTRSYLKEVRILAVEAPFDQKDKLKSRYYRWNPQQRVWFKDVFEDQLDEERKFLELEIYRGSTRHEEVIMSGA